VGKKTVGALCLTRSKKTGNFKPGDVNALKLIYPHLQNRLRWDQIIHTDAKDPFTQNIVPAVKGKNEQLTMREQEIARLVMSGASNQEVAALLGISINTVKMHLQNIFDKLQIKRRCQLFLIENNKRGQPFKQ
jgi:DNA-binding CsgD family transcriptional regulator